MYNVYWDEDANGVFLSLEKGKRMITPPRPVFKEELDNLGFDEYYTYEDTKNPILWNIGRRYYYRGEEIATARGGDSFNKPRLITKKEGIKLHHWNAEDDMNEDTIMPLQYHTQVFAEMVAELYPNSKIVCMYSTGKDSGVLLNILYPIFQERLNVIFSDVGLENKMVDLTFNHIQTIYPNCKFHRLSSARNTLDLVDEMGLPSRFHRWCTPALKVAPFQEWLKKNVDEDETVIIFEGVRSSESKTREDYSLITNDDENVVRVRPLLNWNETEIYLYILLYDVYLNPLYREGLRRVSCEVCPFISDWSDCIYGILHSKYHSPIRECLHSKIMDYAKAQGSDNPKEYIEKAYWKTRAGGSAYRMKPRVEFNKSTECFTANVYNPSNESIHHEWLKLANVDWEADSIQFGYKLTFKDITTKQRTLIKKLVKKTAFCVGCGVCQASCKTGALKVNPIVTIDKDKCRECGDCIIVNYHGCHRARSLYEK